MQKVKDMIQKVKQKIDKFIPVIGFIFIVLVFGILTQGNLFGINNLKILLRQTIIIYTVALGLLLVFTNGSFDISVGAVIAVSAMIISLVYDATGMLWLALLSAIIATVIIYVLNIVVATKFGLLTTISSLAVMFIARGIVTLAIAETGSIISTDADLALFRNNYWFILGYFLVVTITFIVIYNHTKIGKYNKAIGDNEKAAALSGINVNKYKYISYLIAGIMVGLASIFFLARTGTVSEKAGMGLEMDVIVALILGGMNLVGGSKSDLGAAIFGSLSYVVLGNGLMIAGVDTEWIALLKGIIFLGVVLLTVSQRRSKLIPK